MKNKAYECELCGRECAIRTRIKNRDSENYGKRACPFCASQNAVPKEKKVYRLPKQSTRNKQEKQEKRGKLEPFFHFHIDRIVNTGARCANCGIKLTGSRHEVAHVLPKRKYESVMNNLNNAVYLCGMMGNNCHSKWDSNENNLTKLLEMKAAPQFAKAFKKILPLVTENGSELATLEELAIKLDSLSK